MDQDLENYQHQANERWKNTRQTN